MPTNSNQVPMMFRAQIEGRCQLQYAQSGDVDEWTEEWKEAAATKPPSFAEPIQTNKKDYTISWRFVTNGGQDDGIIRPVIGSMGSPFYPGSSMKGAFREACKLMEKAKKLPAGTVDRYCGTQPSKNKAENSTKPGILRFHGGYPTSGWKQNLVDIVHPQQDWQVKTHNTRSKSGGAFAQISLYKPKLQFGISSTVLDVNWDEVWQIWDLAIGFGIGCRVSAGYGRIVIKAKRPSIYRESIRGEGPASQLINGSSEFRPNIFRAALRGHALRIFGGFTDSEDEVNEWVATLFGGIEGNANHGLLNMTFYRYGEDPVQIPQSGRGLCAVDAYEVEGEVVWSLTRHLPKEKKEALTNFLQSLMQFAMLLGGFGKSWRRADHRLFYSDHYEKPIGCHWTWSEESLAKDKIRSPEQVTELIEKVRENALIWITKQASVSGITLSLAASNPVVWREVWHQGKVQVWGRKASSKKDCQAIDWLHNPYLQGNSIKKTSVTGKLGQIGRLWHRMYPTTNQKGEDSSEYLELLTIFPDESKDCKDFLSFLNAHPFDFKQLWPRP